VQRPVFSSSYFTFGRAASPVTLLAAVIVVAAAAVATPAFTAPAAAQAVTDLRVMSFNIRVDSGGGPNRWALRRDNVVKVIDDFDPDIAGLQEDREHQGRFIQDKLPRYAMFGRAASPNVASENNAILYRADRFTELRAGTFWLSETPDAVGSRSWGSKVRTVNWVELADQGNPGLVLVVMNTHWQHTAKGAKARLESARIMRRRIAKIAPEVPVILLGDFNADQGSAPYDRLTGRAAGGADEDDRFLVDTFRNRHPETSSTVGTAHRFTGKAGKGRIDWILHDDGFQTLAADIVRTRFNNRYPSDHFPVTAMLEPVTAADVAAAGCASPAATTSAPAPSGVLERGTAAR
jgi:endonuclease/exonuclease/phosphatase family metal-dependent hydrolase